jgi:dihydrofolate reductase
MKNQTNPHYTLSSKPHLYLIAAMSENHVIGIDNRLPWHLPDEWKNFRKVTDGKPFLMGRKSYEAPDALHSSYRNVILTEHSENASSENLEYAHDLGAALALLKDENEVFVLGGESVFRQTIPLAQKLFLTIVHAHIDGDASFPALNAGEWELVNSEYHGIDKEHAYSFSMNVYERKAPAT